MLRFGVVAAVSALTLMACDVVVFPGTNDVPGPGGGGSFPPAPNPDPVSLPDPEETPPVIVSPDPEPVDQTETVTVPDETTTEGDGETVDPVVEGTESEGTETVDPDAENTVTEGTDTESTETEGTETPELTPVSSIDSLLEVNAEICAASENPTMTVAEVAGADEPQSTFGTAVVAGEIADRSNFPGIVKLEPRRRIPGTTRTTSGHCAATRIAEQWFITAAHCLDAEYDEVNIIAGVNQINDPRAIRLNAQTTNCHSSYGGSAEEYANDIALIKMDPLTSNLLVNVPIADFGLTDNLLGATNYPTVDMAGWGLTSFSESISNTLLELSLIHI